MNNEKFERLVNEYYDYLRYERKYQDLTIKDYEEDIKILKEYAKDNNLDPFLFTYQEVRGFCNFLDEKKYKPSSISRILSSLRSLYKYLARKEIIKQNPFNLVKSPKQEKKLPKFLYYNELEEIFSIPNINTTLGLRDRLILELLYATGMRVSELENIKINDIDFNRKTIKILGKGNKERLAFFGDYANEYLLLYLEKRKELLHKKEDQGYLLLNKNGDRLQDNGIRYIIDNIIKKSSLKTKVSPHMLRHTFATHLLNEGCDILSVQELLGHESIKATQIYTHITDDHLKEVYFKAHPRNKKITKGEK